MLYIFKLLCKIFCLLLVFGSGNYICAWLLTHLACWCKGVPYSPDMYMGSSFMMIILSCACVISNYKVIMQKLVNTRTRSKKKPTVTVQIVDRTKE